MPLVVVESMAAEAVVTAWATKVDDTARSRMAATTQVKEAAATLAAGAPMAEALAAEALVAEVKALLAEGADANTGDCRCCVSHPRRTEPRASGKGSATGASRGRQHGALLTRGPIGLSKLGAGFKTMYRRIRTLR